MNEQIHQYRCSKNQVTHKITTFVDCILQHILVNFQNKQYLHQYLSKKFFFNFSHRFLGIFFMFWLKLHPQPMCDVTLTKFWHERANSVEKNVGRSGDIFKNVMVVLVMQIKCNRIKSLSLTLFWLCSQVGQNRQKTV